MQRTPVVVTVDHITTAANFLSPPALMEPFVHVARLPSKNVRGHFVDAVAGKLLQLSQRSVTKLHHATAILHSASLLFDDIEDGSLVRRGEPAAHVIFGMPLALNAASSACCAALELMLKVDDDDEEINSDDEKNKKRQQKHRGGGDVDNEEDDDNSNDNDDTADPMIADRMTSQVAASAVSTCLQSGADFSCGNNNNSNSVPSRDTTDNNSNSNLAALRHSALCGRLTRVYLDAMRLLHSGQGKDILWRDLHQCPTLPEYRLMARQKTGGLFRLVAMWALELHCFEEQGGCCKMMIVNGDQHQKDCNCPARDPTWRVKLLSLCDDFGLCFQILDDVSNICDKKLHAMKSFCDDLDEGKFSYPAIHCILHGQSLNPPDTRLMHALRKQRAVPGSVGGGAVVDSTAAAAGCGGVGGIKSLAEKEFCVNLMRDAGSIEASCAEVLSLAQQLKTRTRELVLELEGFGGSSAVTGSSSNSEAEQPASFSGFSPSALVSFELMVCGLVDVMAQKAHKFREPENPHKK